jgi:hypothetical protein
MVVIFPKHVFANQYSSLSESKSLFVKRCSVEKVHFKVVKFVNIIFVCDLSPTHNA